MHENYAKLGSELGGSIMEHVFNTKAVPQSHLINMGGDVQIKGIKI